MQTQGKGYIILKHKLPKGNVKTPPSGAEAASTTGKRNETEHRKLLRARILWAKQAAKGLDMNILIISGITV